MGITFKTIHPTGAYRSFSHSCTIIKVDKQRVGEIVWSSAVKGGMKVMLQVKSADLVMNPGGWKNIILAKTFEGFGDEIQTKLAKVWVKEHWASISKKYEIVPLTD